jgi:hypothetical protein
MLKSGLNWQRGKLPVHKDKGEASHPEEPVTDRMEIRRRVACF